MSARNPDYRRIKRHHAYTVEELSKLLDRHPNTVRNWCKEGLEPIDEKRPLLLKGETAIDFLKQRRQRSRQPCPASTIYCVGCHTPRRPALDMAEYLPVVAGRGDLRGICPNCGRLIYRRVRQCDLPVVAAGLDVSGGIVTQP